MRSIEVLPRAGGGALPSLGEVVARDVNRLKLEVTGELSSVIDALAGHGVRSLITRQRSLEEIFLHHYDPLARVSALGPARPAAAGASHRPRRRPPTAATLS